MSTYPAFVSPRDRPTIRLVLVSEATTSRYPSIDTIARVETAPASQAFAAPPLLARSLPTAATFTPFVQRTFSRRLPERTALVITAPGVWSEASAERG